MTGKDIPFLAHPSNPRNHRRSESPKALRKLDRLSGSQDTSDEKLHKAEREGGDHERGSDENQERGQ